MGDYNINYTINLKQKIEFVKLILTLASIVVVVANFKISGPHKTTEIIILRLKFNKIEEIKLKKAK